VIKRRTTCSTGSSLFTIPVFFVYEKKNPTPQKEMTHESTVAAQLALSLSLNTNRISPNNLIAGSWLLYKNNGRPLAQLGPHSSPSIPEKNSQI
jgi:hypothetical protein